jgi:acyl carrier protein
MATKIRKNKQEKNKTEVRDWLVYYIAKNLNLDSEQIDTNVSFYDYNLDSAIAIELTGDLSNWLEQDIDPMLLYDYPTIELLVDYLTGSLEVD